MQSCPRTSTPHGRRRHQLSVGILLGMLVPVSAATAADKAREAHLRAVLSSVEHARAEGERDAFLIVCNEYKTINPETALRWILSRVREDFPEAIAPMRAAYSEQITSFHESECEPTVEGRGEQVKKLNDRVDMHRDIALRDRLSALRERLRVLKALQGTQ